MHFVLKKWKPISHKSRWIGLAGVLSETLGQAKRYDAAQEVDDPSES